MSDPSLTLISDALLDLACLTAHGHPDPHLPLHAKPASITVDRSMKTLKNSARAFLGERQPHLSLPKGLPWAVLDELPHRRIEVPAPIESMWVITLAIIVKDGFLS